MLLAVGVFLALVVVLSLPRGTKAKLPAREETWMERTTRLRFQLKCQRLRRECFKTMETPDAQ